MKLKFCFCSFSPSVAEELYCGGSPCVWSMKGSLCCFRAECIRADQDNISLMPTAQTAGGVELKIEFNSPLRILGIIFKEIN